MDLEGNVISSNFKPTSEAKMHLIIYKKLPEINAVVHAHPSFSTGFAAAGIAMNKEVLPEPFLVLGKIPLVEYSTPSTDEVPDNLEKYLLDNKAFLLSNHGALTIGKDLSEAFHRIETLEVFAKILLISRILGGEKILTSEQLEKLKNIKR